jgi:hypothetical protein
MMNRWWCISLVTCLSFALSSPLYAQSEDPLLPQVFLDTTYPTQTGNTINVAAGGDLQAAINAAQPGDTIKIAAGATFVGNFVLPVKSNPNNLWIVIRSASTTFDPGGLVPPGTRVDGRDPAHTSPMPKIMSGATNTPAIRTAAAAHHYRLVGLEIATVTSVTSNTQTVALGQGEATLAQLPTDIVIDRCFIHGNTTGNYRRGVALNGIRQSVIDSYLTEFHDANTDAQGIAGWHGPGPFKIVNNHIEATDENIMFGGSGPSINGVVPSDIEIRRNISTKPLSWRGVHRVKNAFELKAGRRVLVEGNIFENVWESGQDGTAILLKSNNPPNDSCTWCVTEHVTFRNNIVRHAAHGFRVNSRERGSGSVVNPPDANHIKVENVLFYDINNSWNEPPNEGIGGRLFTVLKNVAHFQVVHVTAESPYWILFPETTTDSHPNMTFRDSIVERRSFGVGSGADEGTVTLNRNFSPYTWNKVVLVNNSTVSDASLQGRYPAGTLVAADFDAVGFVDWRNDNWRLSPTSPYKGAASDGKDIGADIDVIERAIAGDATPSGQSPYNGAPAAAPGSFEAEHFDLGGEGVAYHDLGAGNAGGAFRTSEDVDIILPSGNNSGYVINNIQTGEWLEYTINVATAGIYNIELRVSSEWTTSRFHVEIDGINVSGSVPVPNTGWWGTFQYVGTGGLSLSEGQHVLRVHADEQYFNLDAIRIERSQAPFNGTPFPAPGLFEAEHFDLGGEGFAYHDAVPGNAGGAFRTTEDVDIILPSGNNSGYVVNNIQTGEWLEYTIDVATTGTYTIELKVSSEMTTSRFHVEIDGVDVTGSVLVPHTGWWGTFQFVGVPGITLNAGRHVLRVHSEMEYFNLDAIQIR